MLPSYSNDKEYKFTRTSNIKEKIAGWLRLILSDKNSRNIFLFLLLNLSFAFVELTYGIWTNSLGLISDSFHMFFDCTALLCGLAASVITKWRPNERFSYGYVRAEVLAGFVNGLFLLFIAFFIFSEAVERVFEPPDVHHERLLVVSVLGFIVNLVGIFAFQHGGMHHGHSHGGASSLTDIEHKDHPSSFASSHSDTASLLPNGIQVDPMAMNSPYYPASPPQYQTHNGHGHLAGDGHGHSHSHGHGHSHGGGSHGHSHEGGGGGDKIMHGVFLHILADTLGSVGVIISAILMNQFGWMIADPICSMFIAVLVLISTIPLIRDSAYILMQRTPKELESQLPSCYQKIKQLEGVLSVQEPHFWTLCSNVFVGNIKVEVSPTHANPRYLLPMVHAIFAGIGVRNVYVQIDYAST